MKRIKLGFLTVHGETENHSQMMNGVFEAAKNNNAHVIRFASKIFCDEREKYHVELNNLYKVIEAQHLDGLMFLGWMPGLAGEHFDSFLKRFGSMPIVSLGTKYDRVPHVYADPRECVSDLLEHMIEVHGKRRIVFVPPLIPDVRSEVYKEVLEKHGLYHEELLLSHEELNKVEFRNRMKKALCILIDERKVKFDAILVMYDEDAQHLLKELKLRHISVPDELAVASYEDTEFSSYSIPPLTTIIYPGREVGFLGCEKLIKMIHKEPIEFSTAINTKLIIRNSCGCSSNSIKLSKIQAKIQPSREDKEVNDRNILGFYSEMKKDFPNTLINIDKLLHALVRDLEEQTTNCFLEEFQYQLQDVMNRYPYINYIDEIELILYHLRKIAASYIFRDNKELVMFDDMILKAQVIIKEKAIAVIGFGQVQIKRIDQELHYISQNLVDTSNVKELLDVLEESLPILEVPSCYIFKFNDNAIEACDLIFKYVHNKREEVEAPSLSSLLIPDEIIEKHKTLLCQLLFVNNDYLGFVVFEPSLMDERVYHTLSLHISSALKGAILLENLKEEIALRREKETQLRYIANYDSLTSLFNRRCFYQTMNHIIKKLNGDTYNNQKLFLLFIDIDNFKQVNDSLGHDIGDNLLAQISKRLKNLLKSNLYQIPEKVIKTSEKYMKEAIFRIGGDEFTAILFDLNPEAIKETVEKVVEAIKEPYYIGEHIIVTSCSVGISIISEEADSAEEIVKYADTAMYQAKKQKGVFSFHHKSLK